MGHVHRDLTLVAEQGKVEGFFNNVQNVDRLGGMVEDIRDAMMEYQVCIRKRSISSTSDDFVIDFVTARYLR